VIDPTKVAIEPKSFASYANAIEQGGGQVCKMGSDVAALIWTDYARPEALVQMLRENPQLTWVQLPFAGVDAFAEALSFPVRFTSAKGSYREPVAEHALALTLALARALPERVRATAWGKKFAFSLYDSNILILGGGGITEELLLLLSPFRADITVVRHRLEEMPGASRTVGFEALDSHLPKADVVILAAALTESTRHLFNAARFSLMKQSAYLVNVARGPIVHTEDLIDALTNGKIAGAALDVTEPEPLPEGHPLWATKNILITPHTADTNEMVERMFSVRVVENVRAYLGHGAWVGTVDPVLGY
jgi:phosphoglycerate dehydrogenase-like enzyme